MKQPYSPLKLLVARPLRSPLVLLALFGVISGLQNTLAASASWTGLGADSAWTTTGNWSTSPVPGAGDTATFNGAGNGKTAITTAPASLYSYLFDSASCAAYTISEASTTWAVPNGGGITVNSTVTTDQNLSGIQFIRLTNGTVNIVNQGSGLLKIGTCFNANSVANSNMRLSFAPASGSTIEIASGKFIDNASTAGRTTSILVNDAGTVKMSGSGSYSGPDVDGNALTLRQGTFSVSSVTLSSGRSPLGGSGRIQFGEAGQTRTATLQYTATTAQSTDRPFYIIDKNTARFDISQASGNLTITTNITQSAATLGGGSLTKIGAGTLTLTGTNLHTGDTLVSAGTLVVSNNFALTNSAFDTSGAGTLSLPAAVTTPTFGGLKGAVALTLPATVTALTLNPASGKELVFSGALGGGTALALTKDGPGIQTLSGNNSFTGNVTVNAGRLRLAHDNALGTGTKTLFSRGTSRIVELSSGITLGSGITLTMTSNSGDGAGLSSIDGNNTIEGKINVSYGNPALNISSSAGSTLTINGDVQLVESSRPLIFGGASTSDNTVNGDISSSDATKVLSVTKQGIGTWVFKGNNTYSGATTISEGILKLAAGSLGNTAITVTNTGTLAVQPGSVTTISAGSTGAGTAGGSLDLTSRILDMTDGAVSMFNVQQQDSFAGTALTIADGATLKCNLGNSGADLLAVTKGAAVSGTVNVTVDITGATALTPGSYDLVTAASGLSGGTWQFTGGGTAQSVTIGGYVYPLQLSAMDTAVRVTVGLKAPNLSYTLAPGISQRITLADIQGAGLASAQGSPSYAITGVGNPSAQGGTVVHDAGNILYTYPTSGSPATDSFTYTISDGAASATATVSLTFQKQSGSASGSITVSGGVASVTLYGIPGVAYDVQRSTDLSTWATLTAAPPLNATPPFTAGSDGKITFTDNFSDLGTPPAAAFYRTIQH
jgi:autotransporter-associated beta strand protein